MPKKKSHRAGKKKSPAKKSRKPARKLKKARKAAKTRRSAARKTPPSKKPAATRPTAPAKLQKPAGVLLGEVEDYFSRIGVIALNLTNSLNIGDTLHVLGHTTDLTQKVESMQIEHQPVQNAGKGDSIGIKVNDKCRKGDKVYRVP